MFSWVECFTKYWEGLLSSLKRTPRCRVLNHHVVYVHNSGAGGAAMDEGLNRLFYRETVQGSGVSDGKVIRQSGGKMATREALRQAQPLILEAWAMVTISVPEDLVVAVKNAVHLHRGKINPSQLEITPPSVLASVPASHAHDLIAELLEISDGRASISIVIDWFRPRVDPPDTVEQWVASR